MSLAWIRYPTVRGDTLVFVADDDLYSVPSGGGPARRLTTGKGSALRPRLSPDGRSVAFDGTEEGVRDVYVCSVDGGDLRRLTWHGSGAHVLGWTPWGTVVFDSDWQQPFSRWTVAHEVSPTGGGATPLPFGPVSGLAFDPAGAVMVGRHQSDLATWKGYRGGRMGVLWLGTPATGGTHEFRKVELPCAAVHPTWCGGRWFFVGDPERVPQLCSVDGEGRDLRVHTTFDDLAVRFPQSDGAHVVFVHGGDLWITDGVSEARRVPVEVRSQRTELQRRFVSAHRYLERVDVHPDGHSLLLTLRGRVFSMGHWEGPVRQHGTRDGARHRLASATTGDELLLVSDRSGEDRFELWRGSELVRAFDDLSHGRPTRVAVSPDGARAAFWDHTGGLSVLDLTHGTVRELEPGTGRPGTCDWSPDSRWLVWSSPDARHHGAKLRLLCLDGDDAPIDVTDGSYRDFEPSFDPDGQRLWFLSAREFDPVVDVQYFSYGFPRAVRPYAVTLTADGPHPFRPELRSLRSDKAKATGEVPTTRVDAEGLADRVVPFPVAEARYEQIVGVPGGVVLVRGALRGSLDRVMVESGPPRADGHLLLWEHDKQELVEIASRVTRVDVDRKREHLVLRSGYKVRVTSARLEKGSRDELKKTDGPAQRKTGWVDLSRIRVSVEPRAEWTQMLGETWRLMRDHFWDPRLGGRDWPAALARYQGLADRVSTRGELSDLLWCLQGELGTSHAYEMGGDYDAPPTWTVGRLGVDLAWDAAEGGWRVARVVRGEPGTTRVSPVSLPGSRIREGEVVVAFGGVPADPHTAPEVELVGRAGALVELTVKSPGGAVRPVVVQTLTDDRELRYRDWVLSRRRYVAAASGGRLGYVHVPDMGPGGFAEFHRDIGVACDLDGLVVDVRFNRGGHVSQLLLSKLAQRRLGFKVPRWGVAYPYPHLSPAGPMVCVTNELSGSDGDIFSHAWKRLGLGPLIGTRTWGGVVGISPRHTLVDRTMVTQPEYATWFDDVGFGLENHGAEPDVVVELPPAGRGPLDDGEDPQLDVAVRWLLEELARRGPPVAPPRAGG